MAIYAVGGEADCFEPVSGQSYAVETSGSGTRYEANASRGAMRVTAGSSELILNFPDGDETEIWAHMFLYQESVGTTSDWLVFKTAAGDNAYKIAMGSGGTWALHMYDGATWSAALATSVSPVIVDAGAAIDIHILRHASTGVFEVFKDGVSVAQFTGDTLGDAAGIGSIHWVGQAGGSSELNVSQVIVASENTIGWKLVTLHATGNSATNTAWANDYTAIDEFTYDSGDYIETNATNQVETFSAADINAGYSTYNVKAVAVAARATNDSGSVVTDIQAALRVSSTNYFSANLGLDKDSTEHSVQTFFEVNPNTSAAWSQSEVNSAEFGLKSV